MGMRYRTWCSLQYVKSVLRDVFIRKEMVVMGMRYLYSLQYEKSILRRWEYTATHCNTMRYLYSLQYEKSIRNASEETY